MKFIDEVVISVTAGKGGDGSASFRREKYIPFGGPDGGDGGFGGSIYLKGDVNLSTLAKFTYAKVFKAENGDIGRGQKRYGKGGRDLFLPVPLGSAVYDDETGELIGELLQHNQDLLVAYRGARGLGNVHFKSSTNRAPKQFTKGKPGDFRKLKIELRIIADVGIVGLPNAGKSSLVSQISNANLKVDSYPFTTLNPHLAKVNLSNERSFIIADIPGIIEGASTGAGLGFQFLRHISRNKVLIHLIDIKPIDDSDVFQNILTIFAELSQYSEAMMKKKQILVLNKSDLVKSRKAEEVRSKLMPKLNYYFKNKKNDKTDYLLKNVANQVFLISAEKNKGCKQLMEYIFENCLDSDLLDEEKKVKDTN